ncbi:MAG: Ig-like domain-containing protein [Solirubrobacteraceae bacterium]
MSFFDGSTAIGGCTGEPVSGGQIVTLVCQASFPAGTAQVSAAYTPDSSSLVAGSRSAPAVVGVGKGGTSLSLAVTKKVAPGGRATYLATLAVPVSNSGSILPTGSVQFLDGGRPIGACLNQPLSNLTGTCSVRYKSQGTHSISAMYNGDANFNGSSSSASRVQVVRGASKAPRVLGALGATLGWTFYYHPTYSELTVFRAFAIPRGTSILIQCHGNGCPYAKLRLAKYGRSVDLLQRFRHRHLGTGARISVGLTRRRWVGKYYSFTIRAGQAPLIKKACMAPGRTTLARCPTGSTGH